MVEKKNSQNPEVDILSIELNEISVNRDVPAVARGSTDGSARGRALWRFRVR